MRHDIEFSIDRAYDLSKIETEEGISSSYFVQITNNAYNPFSNKNIRMLEEMKNAGHYIGLHYHRNGIENIEDIKNDIIYQADVLSKMLHICTDRFSFHRPLREHLTTNIEIPGLINTYGSQFFVWTDNMEISVAVNILQILTTNGSMGLPIKSILKNMIKFNYWYILYPGQKEVRSMWRIFR